VLLKRTPGLLSWEITMAETSIEWTDATWNPVAGCTVLTAGCTNCYAMRMAARLQAMGVPKYAGLTRKSGERYVWTGAVSLDVTSAKRVNSQQTTPLSDRSHHDLTGISPARSRYHALTGIGKRRTGAFVPLYGARRRVSDVTSIRSSKNASLQGSSSSAYGRSRRMWL